MGADAVASAAVRAPLWSSLCSGRRTGLSDWQPEDVARQNLGFDLRSIRYHDDGSLGEVRYIEVKACARSGAIRLTNNEWKHARKFGEHFWLYIVTDVGTDAPQLHRIHNPAAQLVMGEDIVATGFFIQEDTWRRQAEV